MLFYLKFQKIELFWNFCALGKQAVVVLLCENAHMPSDMIADPGIVMIFAHGVEDVWEKKTAYLYKAIDRSKKCLNTTF